MLFLSLPLSTIVLFLPYHY